MKRFIISIATVLTACVLGVHAADYFVATNGNDGGAGSRDKPFATLQRAADAMQPGDTCWISGGTYRETVTLKGKNNLTFQALPGEMVILSGADPLAGEWRNYQKGIYEIDTAKPVSQVFVDGAPMTYARWPNATFKDRWSPSFWKPNKSPFGSVTDPALARSGIDWTGAILTLNTQPTWNKYTAIVASHKKNDATLRYKHDKLWAYPGGRHTGYFLCGKLAALDIPEEWYYDRQAGKFYLCFPGGAEPKGHSVEVKVRDYGFIAEQCDHVTLKGLHFFAAAFLFRECNNTLVDGCHVRFPNVAYLLTELDRDSKPTVSTTLIGHHNTVRNSSVAYSPTHGLRLLGSYSLVENNIIYDCNQIGSLSYAPLWLGNLEDNVTWEGALKYEGRLKETVTGSVAGSTEAVRAKTGDDSDRAQPAGKCVIRNNTLFKSGNIILAYYEQPEYSVTYNHVYDGGCFVHDVSLIYGNSPQIRGSVIAYNWVHGCPNLAIRSDDQSRSITYHHNVTWDGKLGHIIVKGDDNAVYNNTTLSGTAANRGLNIQTWPEPYKPEFRKLWPLLKAQNTRTQIANNLACTITDLRSSKAWNVPFPPSDPRMANNMITLNIKPLLQDPDNYDFRPKAGSPLVDAGKIIPGITDGFVGKAPDIGAYECDGPLWKPGHQNTLWVSEPDADSAFRVALAMPPTGPVRVSITAENKEAVLASIRFDEKDWMIPQKVVLPGKGRYLITAESKEIKPIPQKTIQVKRVNTTVIPTTQPGNAYTWMARHNEILKIKAELNPDLVFIGDSITHHWGGVPNDRLKNGERVLKTAFNGHRVLNLGFGSDRTQHVLWRLDHGELEGLKPKWVVVNIGTNNAGDGNPAEETMAGIQAVCERVRKQCPNAKVILMSIFPRDERPGTPRRKLIGEVNRMIAGYARENGITNLDLTAKFLDRNGKIPKALMPDFCHPAAQGYQLWADALMPLLK